ncbi:MAG: carbohydrate kinase family protein [Minicystis sp.]
MVFLVAGDANADVSAALSRFPHEGDDSPLLGLGWTSGGSAANVATAIARMGARARLVARVGVDPAAEVALRAARAAGVDLATVQEDEAIATGLCFAAISPGGERTFFSYRGANVALAPGDVEATFREARWLHVGGHALIEGAQREAALALIAEAGRRNVPVSLDLCLPLLRAAPGVVIDLGAAPPCADRKSARDPDLRERARHRPAVRRSVRRLRADPRGSASDRAPLRRDDRREAR